MRTNPRESELNPLVWAYDNSLEPWKNSRIPVGFSGADGASRRARPALRDTLKVSWPGGSARNLKAAMARTK